MRLLVCQRRVEHADSFKLLRLIRSLALIIFLHFPFPLPNLKLLNHSFGIFDLDAFFEYLLINLTQILSSLFLFLDFPLQLAVLLLHFLHCLLFIGVPLIQILYLLLESGLFDLVLHVELLSISLILFQSLAELILKFGNLSLKHKQLIRIS